MLTGVNKLKNSFELISCYVYVSYFLGNHHQSNLLSHVGCS